MTNIKLFLEYSDYFGDKSEWDEIESNCAWGI